MGIRKGHYIIRKKYFRVYINGSFSKLEVDFGKAGGWELAVYIWTKRGAFVVRINPSLEFLKRCINIETNLYGF